MQEYLSQDHLKPRVESLSRRTRRRLALEENRRKLEYPAVVNSIISGNNLTSDSGRGRSGLWSDCPWEELQQNQSRGFAYEDDFVNFPLPGTQTTEISLPSSPYKVYSTGTGVWQADSMPSSTTIATPQTLPTPVAGQGGIISCRFNTDADSAAIGTQQCPVLLTTTQAGKVWFEARIAISSIATNIGQLFCGLCENVAVTFGASTPLANANATASGCAMIGFNRLEDGLSVLNTSYADHAAVWTDVQASASSGVLAAETFIKLGIKVDMKDITRCVRFYVNNIETSTAMTKAALLALTHLDVKPLGPCLAFFADTAGTATDVYLDQWAWAQMY